MNLEDRMPVKIVRGSKRNEPGLPRPLAPAPDGKLRPVPYTNDHDGKWSQLHYERAERCTRDSLCLICGERVDEGVILVDKKSSAHVWTAENGPEKLKWVMDGGPLHDRCYRLTVAHCEAVRKQMVAGSTFAVHYRRRKLLTQPGILEYGAPATQLT